MKKLQLKTGQRVEFRNGLIALVLCNIDNKTELYITYTSTFVYNINDDLLSTSGADVFDIIRVYDRPKDLKSLLDVTQLGEVLFTRK